MLSTALLLGLAVSNVCAFRIEVPRNTSSTWLNNPMTTPVATIGTSTIEGTVVTETIAGNPASATYIPTTFSDYTSLSSTTTITSTTTGSDGNPTPFPIIIGPGGIGFIPFIPPGGGPIPPGFTPPLITPGSGDPGDNPTATSTSSSSSSSTSSCPGVEPIIPDDDIPYSQTPTITPTDTTTTSPTSTTIESPPTTTEPPTTTTTPSSPPPATTSRPPPDGAEPGEVGNCGQNGPGFVQTDADLCTTQEGAQCTITLSCSQGPLSNDEPGYLTVYNNACQCINSFEEYNWASSGDTSEFPFTIPTSSGSPGLYYDVVMTFTKCYLGQNNVLRWEYNGTAYDSSSAGCTCSDTSSGLVAGNTCRCPFPC